MAKRARFSDEELRAIDATKYFRLRAGTEHRHVAVWVVVVDGRVLVRSWNDKPSGWYRAFLVEREGSVVIGEHEVPVRARRLRGERILDAMDAAYAAKYTTKPNASYVEGFRDPARRACTLELLPG